MIKIKHIALAVASAALFTSVAANAASWTEFMYAGYGTGYQYSDLSTYIPAYTLGVYNGIGGVNPDFKPTSNAWLNTLFFGIGNQSNDGWYWGLEVNGNYANARGFSVHRDYYANNAYNVQHRVNVSLDWSVDVDALFGHTLDSQQHWLGYVKVGPSVAEAKVSYKAHDANSGGAYANYRLNNASKVIYGALLGLGVRYDLGAHWVAGVEGDVTYYPNQTVISDSDFSTGSGVLSTSIQYGFHPILYAAKATIAYRF